MSKMSEFFREQQEAQMLDSWTDDGHEREAYAQTTESKVCQPPVSADIFKQEN